MSIIGVAIIGAVGTGFAGYEATQAAKAQSQALSTAAGDIRQGQTQAIGALTQNLQQYLGPYAQFGQGLQGTLSSLLTPGPNQNATLSQLPGFQFARDLAGYGVAAGAGRTGISGSTAVEGGTLESALASQNWTNYINPLLNLYGKGQGAASTLGTTLGQGISSIYTGGAQNLANLAVGQGNVQAGLAGTYGSLGSNFAGNLGNLALLSKLSGGTGGGLFGGQQSTPNYPLQGLATPAFRQEG